MRSRIAILLLVVAILVLIVVNATLLNGLRPSPTPMTQHSCPVGSADNVPSECLPQNP